MNKQQPKIARLLHIDSASLTIVALWTNKETRLIDFVPLFAKWKKEGEIDLLPLSDAKIFSTVSLSRAKTLQWKTVQKAFVWKGETRYEPIELDPYVLFAQSTLINSTVSSSQNISPKTVEKNQDKIKSKSLKPLKPVNIP